MIGYSSTDVFTKREQSLLGMAKVLIECLPETPGLRCHEVSRAVGVVLGLEVRDGRYGSADHSWLVIPPMDGRKRESILDVYAVGSLPTVRLSDTFPLLPHNGSYRVMQPRDDVDEGLVMDLVDLMHGRLLGTRSS